MLQKNECCHCWEVSWSGAGGACECNEHDTPAERVCCLYWRSPAYRASETSLICWGEKKEVSCCSPLLLLVHCLHSEDWYERRLVDRLQPFGCFFQSLHHCRIGFLGPVVLSFQLVPNIVLVCHSDGYLCTGLQQYLCCYR